MLLEKSAGVLKCMVLKMGANFSITDHIGNWGYLANMMKDFLSLSGKDSTNCLNFENRLNTSSNSVVKFKSLTTGISLIFSF